MLAAVSVAVPEPSFSSWPLPETVPLKTNASDRLIANVPLVATVPRIEPDAPPSPSASMPPSIRVPPEYVQVPVSHSVLSPSFTRPRWDAGLDA